MSEHNKTNAFLAAFLALIFAAALLLSGCFTRTIYVPPGKSVRLRETIRGAKIWALDAESKPVAGTIDLPEGWYVLPDVPEN